MPSRRAWPQWRMNEITMFAYSGESRFSAWFGEPCGMYWKRMPACRLPAVSFAGLRMPRTKRATWACRSRRRNDRSPLASAAAV